MSDTQHQLKAFLSTLLELIDTQAIQQENHLEQVVRVRTQQQLAILSMLSSGVESSRTLLELLGYDVADVADHPRRTIIGTVSYEPDYLLQSGERPLVVLDLKAPEVSLNSDRAVSQICTYCRGVKAPLGLLFNGSELRVFINTEYKGLTKYKEFSLKPVAVVDRHDLAGMAELLSRFNRSALFQNPLALARKLADKRWRELNDQQRQAVIRKNLREMLSNPPAALLAALPVLDGVWDDLEPKPSETEIVHAWRTQKTADVTGTVGPTRTGANPELRRTVAEVCATKGWQAIEQAKISGLRYRLNGIEERGFRLVPQGAGVPTGLCVQGRDAPGARRIIAELQSILQGG